jgi:hypothetical protein
VAYKLIGNAVPPLLAYHIAKRIEKLWNIYFNQNIAHYNPSQGTIKKHHQRKERGGKASPFSFLIDTIISINTIGFLGSFAKCFISISYKRKINVKSEITTPLFRNNYPPFPK